MTMPTRHAYTPWRDASGTQIPQHCRVQQVAVGKATEHCPHDSSRKARSSVAASPASTRFDDENELGMTAMTRVGDSRRALLVSPATDMGPV